MPDPSGAGVAGVIGVTECSCKLDADCAWTRDSAEPVWAGGAANIPTLDPELLADAFAPLGVGTAYDTAVLTGENMDECCNGGVGYKQKDVTSSCFYLQTW